MAGPIGTEKIKQALRFTRLGDSVAVVLKGNLGQRAAVLVGLGMIAFAVYWSWQWGALILGGWLLCYLGLYDYERDTAMRGSEAPSEERAREAESGGR